MKVTDPRKPLGSRRTDAGPTVEGSNQTAGAKHQAGWG